MARVKKNDYENLTETNIQKVITLLTPSDTSQKPITKPITKKEACEILNIAYNTTRLNKIIQEFQERQEYVARRKKQNRGKSATNGEVSEAVTAYLQGEKVSSIAKSLYRSPAFIKNILETVGVPSRPSTLEEKTETAYIPEPCVSETFQKGQIVWSANHHAAAIIEDELSIDHQAERAGFRDLNYEKKYSSKCYSIYVMEEIRESDDFWIGGITTGGYFAYALAYDLASLEHLKEYGVDLTRI